MLNSITPPGQMALLAWDASRRLGRERRHSPERDTGIDFDGTSPSLKRWQLHLFIAYIIHMNILN